MKREISSDAALITKDLKAGYGKKIIIADLNMEVGRGKITVLIGPNGSGKSTVLKTVTKEISKLGGAVYLDGTEMSALKEADIATKMSLLMTERPKGELMTVRDMVATGRYPYTGRFGKLREEDYKVIDEAIALSELCDIQGEEFNSLSDGQKQRTMLARSICQEPEVLVLDEPTSFLDIHYKLELLHILKNLAVEKNIAIIMSLHEIDLAQKCADYIVCVDENGQMEYDRADEIFNTDKINRLYNVSKGTYIAQYGSLEMKRVEGDPKVFVIGGAGSAIGVYRQLQRRGIPFAAGIIHKNDMEYPIAKALAVSVTEEEAFEIAGEDKICEAVEVMKKCEYYICTLDKFGKSNAANKVLAQKAEQMGLSVWQK